MIALIMAGGVGSRFWPLSREDNPKQFLSIVSSDSMIRLTVDRFLPKIDIKDIYVVTAASQLELVKLHIPELSENNIIIEPFGMNTAPCIALSLAWLEKKYDQNEVMIVAAADHLITDKEKFYQHLILAEIAAHKDLLVTFGIKPTYPATSYGYIEASDKIEENIWKVAQFKEKPDKKTAKSYLETKRFYWNSGIFTWKLKNIIGAYTRLQPKMWEIVQRIKSVWDKEGTDKDTTSLYKQIPRLPVDIGIMEKSDNIAVIPSDFGWSDIGGWKALHEISPKDENNNYIHHDAITIDSSNNYVYSDKLVSLIGVNNLVVIETEDALLIADKERSEEVKKIVKELNNTNRTTFL